MCPRLPVQSVRHSVVTLYCTHLVLGSAANAAAGNRIHREMGAAKEISVSLHSELDSVMPIQRDVALISTRVTVNMLHTSANNLLDFS